MANYEIQVASELDSSDFAEIANAAFDADPFIKYMKDQRDFARARYEAVHYYKVLEISSRKIVAFAKLQFPHTTTPQLEAEKTEFEEKTHEDHPPGYNVKLYDLFFQSIGQKAANFVDKERFFTLHVLCVSPPYQRQGLGSMLLQHALKFADGEKAPTYLEASPNGLELYKRFGWKEVDEFVINMDEFGGNGMATEKIMIREPRIH